MKCAFIKNNKNMGFAYAVNQGILESTGECVLTLNPDVIVTEGYVDTLFRKITADKRIGAVSGGNCLIWKTKRCWIVLGKSYIKTALPEIEAIAKSISANTRKVMFSVHAPHFLTLYRREMLQDIKMNNEYFDSGFAPTSKMWIFAWRAQTRGWKCYFVDNAIAYRQRAASSQTLLKKQNVALGMAESILNDYKK